LTTGAKALKVTFANSCISWGRCPHAIVVTDTKIENHPS